MSFSIDPKIASYYDVTFILCSLVFCQRCNREAEYVSAHPEYSDESYYDQAVAMHNEGWVVDASELDALCPECAKKGGFRDPAVS